MRERFRISAPNGYVFHAELALEDAVVMLGTLSEPEDQPFGDRIYLARDPEGHEWYFAQHLFDRSIAELQQMFGAPS